jgi:hypothetical protein
MSSPLAPYHLHNKGHGSRDQDIEIQGIEGTLCKAPSDDEAL